MRLDLLLVRLRLARSRAIARRWIEEGHMRRNGARVRAASAEIAAGDVLTLPPASSAAGERAAGEPVRLMEILALPQRRGPASEAAACYRLLPAGTARAQAAPERQASGEGAKPAAGAPRGLDAGPAPALAGRERGPPAARHEGYPLS